jgi:hypothetical protein
MAAQPGMREARGVVRHLVMVEQFPNGEIRTLPVNAGVVREIVLHPDDIEKRMDADPELWPVWNTGDWKSNPSLLLKVEAQHFAKPYVLYGKYTGHEPPRPSLGGGFANGQQADVLQLHQQRRNLFTRASWNEYAGYRQKLMALLEGRSGNVCVLGAGNCNDIDLQLLSRLFERITLVDIDMQAVGEAVMRQGPCRNIAGVKADVSGVFGILAADAPGKCRLAIECLRQRRQTGQRCSIGPFDVVISSCLLTQILFNTRLVVAGEDADFPELLRALRLDHLHLICDLLVPGGLGILATDVISTDLAPFLPTVPEAFFEDAATKLIDVGICMAGVHPWQIRGLIEADDGLCCQLPQVRTLGPWRWTMRPDFVYAVYTHLLHKRAG